jgi:hypothetical protein
MCVLTKLHTLHIYSASHNEIALVELEKTETEMAKLVYRGIVHETGQKPVQTLAEQMRRPVLMYRGVEHDGEKAIEAAAVERRPVFYRGYQHA